MLTPAYVASDPVAGPVRADELGCSWASVLPRPIPSVALPCVVVDYTGNPTFPVVLIEPTTPDAVASAVAAVAPLASALQASAAAQMSATATNYATLVQRAHTALGNNASYLGLASVTQAQAVAQVAALTRQTNAVIRFSLDLLDDIQGT